MRSEYNQNKSFKYVILFVVVIFVLFFLYEHKGRRRAVAGIQNPIQTVATGQKQMELDGYQVKISYLYAYDINALVISTHKYTGTGIGEQLSPEDVALAWGRVAEYNDIIDFHWSQSGRWYRWQTDSYDVLEMVGGAEGVTLQSSNNHLIPADETVKKAIKKIRTGDYIRLTGYLVSIDATKSDGSNFSWYSSTTREDNGSGSCEVVYVTNVEWLD